MSEKILRIEEQNFKLEPTNKYSVEYSGFCIVTDKQVIRLGITNSQSCCENWGYFITNDSTEDFIGTNLLEIKVVDTSLNVIKLEASLGGRVSEDTQVMFVNVETDGGTLQFTAYNEHNGYYGHDAIVVSEQLNERYSL